MRALLNTLALVIAILLSSSSFAATLQARDNVGTTVTLLRVPCVSDGALAELPRLNKLIKGSGQQLAAADMREAGVTYRGKAYSACWYRVGDFVIVIDDGGKPNSIFTVPAADFQWYEVY